MRFYWGCSHHNVHVALRAASEYCDHICGGPFPATDQHLDTIDLLALEKTTDMQTSPCTCIGMKITHKEASEKVCSYK